MLNIIKSGLQTTVQDLGRHGYQKYGVIASGAMDSYAHRIANLLAGNPETEAALEISLAGPVLEFGTDTFIALCGGDLSPKIDGSSVGMWRPVAVRKGSVLSFGAPRNGCRTYLAAAGGIDIPVVMDSKSTYLRAGIGGFHGRALQAGDRVPLNPLPPERAASVQKALNGEAFRELNWQHPAVSYPEKPIVRVMKGRQHGLFDEASKTRFLQEAFSVSTQSDRMGYRLEDVPLLLSEKQELISEAVTFGSIQVPPDGNPIVLLADRQTTGGYPKIGQVATVDLPLISQLKPGGKLRFREISLQEAQALLLQQEQEIRQLKRAIQLKWEEWT